MWPGFRRSTLLSDDHDRAAEREDAAGDVAVAGADPLARVDDEDDHVEVVGDRLLDAALHPLGQRVDRLLPAGQVDEHELGVLLRPDPADAVARRVRDARDDRDLLAGERVRRASTCRRSGGPASGGEARPHSGQVPAVRAGARPGVVGADLAVVAAVAHLVDPELVEPLPAAAARRGGDPDRLEVAGPAAGRDGGGDRVLLGADPERVGGVLDVHAGELAPVARPDDGADEVVRVRRVRVRRRGLGLLDRDRLMRLLVVPDAGHPRSRLPGSPRAGRARAS